MSSVRDEGSDDGPDGVTGDVSTHTEDPVGSGRASASVELGRILEELSDARRQLSMRSERRG